MTTEMSASNVKCRDLIYVGISVPVSLALYATGKVYSRATNHNGIYCCCSDLSTTE